MDLYDFYNTFITAVGQNASIASWSNTHFGKAFKVFADVTSADLPTIEDAPYCIFEGPGFSRHQERSVQMHSIGIELCLNKDALATRGETNIEQPAGIELVNDLVTLVIAAVKAALPANTVFGVDGAMDTLGALPAVYAYLDFNFETKVTIAGDPLA